MALLQWVVSVRPETLGLWGKQGFTCEEQVSEGLSVGAESLAEAWSPGQENLPSGSGRDFYVGYTQACLVR